MTADFVILFKSEKQFRLADLIIPFRPTTDKVTRAVSFSSVGRTLLQANFRLHSCHFWGAIHRLIEATCLLLRFNSVVHPSCSVRDVGNLSPGAALEACFCPAEVSDKNTHSAVVQVKVPVKCT